MSQLIDTINETRICKEEDIKELLKEALNNSQKYRPCDKCGFISVSKETNVCMRGC